jgi:nicotinamide-nucleotide amidase
MGANNRRQAFLPENSIPIYNPVGTAPGFIVEDDAGTIIALPGVPREMEHLMQHSVLPYLRQRMGSDQSIIKARVLRTVGLGESYIDERIDPLMHYTNPTVGLAAHSGMADIRITARAVTEAEADAMIAVVEQEVRDRLGNDGIFGTGSDLLEVVTARLLAEAGVVLATVESATGGEVALRLRSSPEGASVVTAAHVVGGPAELCEAAGLSPYAVEAYGLVSELVAAEAAAALSDTYERGWGLAVLGDLHAPDDVYGNDTGQTYVALVGPGVTEVRHFPYGGSGPLASTWITLRTLDLLRRQALRELSERHEV